VSATGGIRFGHYVLLRRIARGGMAEVFLAQQRGLEGFDRRVAIKRILPHLLDSPDFVKMFLGEAKLAAQLSHPNIVHIYEFGKVGGDYFIAMEYVDGVHAGHLFKHDERMPYELVARIGADAAAALHYAHELRGPNGKPLDLVHRDVSPANIMVGYDGSIKVLDFGIAKAEERATKTVGGTIKGKYGYMSPEQCKGKPIDRRSDIFALGICLYELTTLRRAFKGNDDFETMKRIVSGDVVLPSVAVPGYPRELEAITLTALATDPNARFQTGQELIEALDAFTVRAKLTGSNTAMGRFMVQLFGSKKEPWVEGGSTPNNLDTSEEDNEKTTLIEHKPDTMPGGQVDPRVLGITPGPDDRPTPVDAETEMAAWQSQARDTSSSHARTASDRIAVQTPPPVPVHASQQIAVPRTVTPGAPHAQPAQHAPYPTHPAHGPPSQQMHAFAPAPPPRASAPHPIATPTSGPYAAPQQPMYPQQYPVHAAHPANQAYPSASQPVPHPAGAVMSPMSHTDETGGRPLVDDPSLGWATQIDQPQALVQPGHTRLASDVSSAYKIKSDRTWLYVVLAVILVAVAAVTVMIALQP